MAGADVAHQPYTHHPPYAILLAVSTRCFITGAEARTADLLSSAGGRAWLPEYNHHRPHTAIGNHPPITRLTNLSRQYS